MEKDVVFDTTLPQCLLSLPPTSSSPRWVDVTCLEAFQRVLRRVKNQRWLSSRLDFRDSAKLGAAP